MYAELSDSFDWASYLMEGIEYPRYSDTDEVRRERKKRGERGRGTREEREERKCIHSCTCKRKHHPSSSSVVTDQ